VHSLEILTFTACCMHCNQTCITHAHTTTQQLKRLCLVFAKQHDTPAGLYPHTVFSMVGIEDSSKLTLRICFRQKSNWQIGIKKWATQVTKQRITVIT
jgi:hypothetical protein